MKEPRKSALTECDACEAQLVIDNDAFFCRRKAPEVMRPDGSCTWPRIHRANFASIPGAVIGCCDGRSKVTA
jgi:hypothetical protein